MSDPDPPQEAPECVSCDYAAEAASTSLDGVSSAVRRGQLEAVHRRGRLLITRASLESWLDWLREWRAETDSPRLISIREAAERARCTKTVLYGHFNKGGITGERNEAGRLLLHRSSFEAWLAAQPPHVDELSGDDLFTLAELAEAVGLDRSSLGRAVKRGRLKATLCRRDHGLPAYYVRLSDWRAWLARRQARFDAEAASLKAPLTLVEAARRNGLHREVLYEAVQRGELLGYRRGARHGAFEYVVETADLERFVASREAAQGWTIDRLTGITGVGRSTLLAWLKQRGLPAREGIADGGGMRWEFHPQDLAPWLERSLPPYAPEVANLKSTLTLGAASRLLAPTGLGRREMRKAIWDGELDAIILAHPWGARYTITRYALDRWCRSQGHPTSAELVGEQPLLRTVEAARLAGRQVTTIRNWIEAGKVASVRRGKRLLVDRQSLLDWLGTLPPEASQDDEADLTVAQAARLAGRNHGAMLRLIHAQELPAQVVQGTNGPEYRISHDDLAQYLRRKLEGPFPLAKVARKFGVKVVHLTRAASTGQLPAVREGRYYKVHEQDVIAWLRQREERRNWKQHPDLLTVAEVARRFGVEPTKVTWEIRNGRLPATRCARHQGASAYLIAPEDAARCNRERWLKRPSGDWLDLGEASDRCGLARVTLSRAVAEERLRGIKFPPGSGRPSVFIKPEDLDQFMKTRQKKTGRRASSRSPKRTAGADKKPAQPARQRKPRAAAKKPRHDTLAPELEALTLKAPVELIVLAIGKRTVRCRALATNGELSLRTMDIYGASPGEVITVGQCRVLPGARRPSISGEIVGRRFDVGILDLKPLELRKAGTWDPLLDYRSKTNVPRSWERSIIERGRRRCYEMERVTPLTVAGRDPIAEASRRYTGGDWPAAREVLVDLLAADLRSLDAHAHLGRILRSRRDAAAIRHCEAGVRIGELSLTDDFDGLLPWSLFGNRPFLRCLRGYGMCLWQLDRRQEAAAVFKRMLLLNPNDDQRARVLLAAVRAGEDWKRHSG